MPRRHSGRRRPRRRPVAPRPREPRRARGRCATPASPGFPRSRARWLPLLDGIARRWLMRSQSPYVDEVRAIADALGFPGIWFLNGSYQWSCTALARDEDGAPWLARTLDWPFPGLGRFVELARMRGPAGEFINVTWPGYVGVLTALAPGRFAACDQPGAAAAAQPPPLAAALRSCSPMPSATLFRVRAIPPDQLLRAGVRAGAGLRRSKAHAGNHAGRAAGDLHAGRLPRGRALRHRAHRETASTPAPTTTARPMTGCDSTPLWEGRIGASKVLTCTFEEAAEHSRARREGLALWRGSFARDSFGWVAPPVLNPYTRIAVEMNARARHPPRGRLRVARRRGVRAAGDAAARIPRRAGCGLEQAPPSRACEPPNVDRDANRPSLAALAWRRRRWPAPT